MSKDVIRYCDIGICCHCNKRIHYSLNGGVWYHDDNNRQRCNDDWPIYAVPVHERLPNDFLKELAEL